MKARLLWWLETIGHLQAQILLFLLFYGVITPYGILLRCIGKHLLHPGGWSEVEEPTVTIESLERSY